LANASERNGIPGYDPLVNLPASAQASVDVAAPADAVYALITDLPTLAELGEEVDAMEFRKGDAVVVGAVFRGRNSHGSHRWSTSCTVTDAEAGRVFAFDVKYAGFLPIAHWRYDIEPSSGGCTVTERTWDRRPGWFRRPASLSTGVSDRTGANTEHIRVTLERLKARAERG
jgi:hypothetical protein